MNREIFDPVLVTPNPLDVSDEQRDLIRAVLDVSSSDSRFALKAYLAIMKILLGESVVPLITELSPSEGASGTVEPVEVTITGENFEPASTVLQAGAPILSAYVNPTTLTASIALSGAAEGVLAISVRNSTMLTSNVVNFTVLPPAAPLLAPLAVPAADESTSQEEPHPAAQEEVPVATTEGSTTDIDALRARIADFNAKDSGES